MVTHLKLLPLSDCFPPFNEQARKFEGHLCAGSAQTSEEDDEDQTNTAFAYPDTCRGDSGGPVTVRSDHEDDKDKPNWERKLPALIFNFKFSCLVFEQIMYCTLMPTSTVEACWINFDHDQVNFLESIFTICQ